MSEMSEILAGGWGGRGGRGNNCLLARVLFGSILTRGMTMPILDG
jgi:hypothetical protein